MTSWLPGRGSSLGEGEELASAPPFEGEIVKPSAQATPYPTTSTPQGYVVPESGEASPPALVSTNQPAADVAATTASRTPPVTYGMKPAEVAALSDAPAAAGTMAAPGAAPPVDVVAAQEGPYAPLGSPAAAGAASPPVDTVAAGFSAAGGTSVGAYPPEQTVGVAPAASETVTMPAAAPAGAGPSSAFAAAPPASGSSSGSAFAMADSTAAAEATASGGSAFTTQPAPPTAGPTVSAFGQQAAVPQGSSAESPVAGSRYAAVEGSRFGGPLPPPASPSPEVSSGFSPPPAAFESTVASQPPPAGNAPWNSTSAEPPAEPPGQMSSWSTPEAPAGQAFGAAASRSAFDTAGSGDSVSQPQPEAFGSSGGQPSSQPPADRSRPQRRPDPMYRPAGTSSYRTSEPIFSDEPASQSPVQMATFEEPILEPPQQ